ncbi:hypothetical protein ACFSYD_07950 [Paracoccus aerius]
MSERQVSELARLSTSPVLPGNWLLAASETTRLVNGIWENTGQRINERATWNEIRPRLPQVAGYLIAALLLLTLGRHWVETLPRACRRGRWIIRAPWWPLSCRWLRSCCR